PGTAQEGVRRQITLAGTAGQEEEQNTEQTSAPDVGHAVHAGSACGMHSMPNAVAGPVNSLPLTVHYTHLDPLAGPPRLFQSSPPAEGLALIDPPGKTC